MKAAVYCGTRNLYSDMITAAKSLTKNSSVDIIYFLIEDPEFPEELPSHIRCIDVSNQKYFSKSGPNVYKLWTWMVLMRAALPKLFPDLDRILSLDVDTIVDKNIDEFWDLCPDDYYLAGVEEPLKTIPNMSYVNMGSVVFNLKLLRDTGMADKIIRTLNKDRFRFAEQDCINLLCGKKIKSVSAEYNFSDYTGSCQNPKIYHFANVRNWQQQEMVRRYKYYSWDDVVRVRTRYMIHSTPKRQWYVEDFLIPSMVEQGIFSKEIMVYCDRKGKGNLFSCMDAFRYCGEHPVEGGTWHLQDDVIISRDFARKTREYNDGVVCGNVMKEWGPNWLATGRQPASELWYSFQCIRIPDELAGECAKWFYEDASKRTSAKYRNRVLRNKHDDDFFQFFLLEKYPDMFITNLKPNIVDHIDYMIGGSLVNDERKRKINRVAYWENEDLIKELEEDLKYYTDSKLNN